MKNAAELSLVAFIFSVVHNLDRVIVKCVPCGIDFFGTLIVCSLLELAHIRMHIFHFLMALTDAKVPPIAMCLAWSHVRRDELHNHW